MFAFTPPTYLYRGSSADSAAALATAKEAPRSFLRQLRADLLLPYQ